MRVSILASAAWLAVGAGAAQADPYEGVPNPRYPDGTGDAEVDQLNRGQLEPPPGSGPPPGAYDGQPVMGRGMYGGPPPPSPAGAAQPPYGYGPPPYSGATAETPQPAVPPGLYGAPPAMYGAPPPPQPND